jgi:hypothetical protein
MVKYAFLIGINYRKTADELYGCINDVNNIKNFLQSKLGYTNSNIVTLTDDTSVKPTRKNILKGIADLVKNLKSGDEAWVHFSGHGVLVRDYSGDEKSGYDSCFAPIDYNISGFISDDVIRSNLAQRVPRGVKLYVVLDACHSGTGCDLRHKYDDSSYLTNQIRNSNLLTPTYIPSEWSHRQTSYEFAKHPRTVGEVYCISGCQDNQESGDTYIESDQMYGGVLTSTMLSLLKSNDLKTYKWKDLLKDVCCSEKVNGYAQRTALTSGNPINMESAVFSFPVVRIPVPVKKNYRSNYRTMNVNPMNAVNQTSQTNPHKNKNIMKKMFFV